MKIRDANIDDEDFIKTLHSQHKKHIGSFNLFWSWDKYLKRSALHKYMIAENESGKLGFVRYGFSKKNRCFVLYEIAVDTKTTEKGVGKFLFEQLPKPLMLKCNCDNERGNIFYKNMGMTKASVTKTKKGVAQNIWWIT